MDKDLDALLESELVRVPDDFTGRIMQRIYMAPLPARRPTLPEKLQELALIAGGIAGAAQLAAFMFGVWTASSVG